MAQLTADLYAQGAKRDVYLPVRIFGHHVAYLGSNPFTHTLTGNYSTLAARGDVGKRAVMRAEILLEVSREAPPAERELHIVAIGNSSSRHNWQLYGYGGPTDPCLVRRPRLITFTDPISPASITSRSIPLSFAFATPDDPHQFSRLLSLVSKFKQAGFKTCRLSNQGVARSAVGGNLNTRFLFCK